MKKRWIERSALAGVAAALVWSAGCASPDGRSGDWILVALGENGAVPVAEARLRIVGSSLRGEDGCNSLTAALSGSPRSGVVVDLQTTLRACAEAAVRREASFVSAVLASSPRYRVHGDTLRFTSPAGDLSFRRSSP